GPKSGHDRERAARCGLNERVTQALIDNSALLIDHIAERRVGDVLQRRQRDEAVAAAVLVELYQRVIAVDLQAQISVADHIFLDDAEIREQVVEIDLVLAGLEPGDYIAAQLREIVGIAQAIEEQIAARTAAHLVGAETALDHVIAIVTAENVRAGKAVDRVRSLAARDGIHSGRAADRVVEVVTVDGEIGDREPSVFDVLAECEAD